MSDPEITRMGERRVHQRCGLPKRAIRRLAGRAMAAGFSVHTAPREARLYLASALAAHRELQAPRTSDVDARLYAGVLFLFAEGKLITCWRVPPREIGGRS